MKIADWYLTPIDFLFIVTACINCLYHICIRSNNSTNYTSNFYLTEYLSVLFSMNLMITAHWFIFSSAGWTFHVSWSKCCLSVCLDVCVWMCVCLYVNQGGTNHNCCTQRLVVLHAQTYSWTLLSCQNQVNVTYFMGQNHSRKKVAMNRHFEASWASQPLGCLLFALCYFVMF